MIRRPDGAERLMRLVYQDRLTKLLTRLVLYSYDRCDDGPHVKGKTSRRFWGYVGDRADKLQMRWVRRPMRSRQRVR